MTGIETAALLSYMAAAGAAVSAVATISAADSQASADDYNAKVQEQNAVTTHAQGNANEELQRQRARAQIGRQLAATSESGTGLSGSNKDLLSDSLNNMQADALNIRYDSDLKANGMNAQAALDSSQAGATRTGGYLSAAGKLASASSSYLNGSKTVPSYAGSDSAVSGGAALTANGFAGV